MKNKFGYDKIIGVIVHIFFFAAGFYLIGSLFNLGASAPRAVSYTEFINQARDWDENLRREIVAALEEGSGYRLRPVWQVKPELIGGFRANIADTVFDASVKGRLEALRERLLAGAVKPDRQIFAKQLEKLSFLQI